MVMIITTIYTSNPYLVHFTGTGRYQKIDDYRCI